MPKFTTNIKVRNPLLSAAPKFRATSRFVYRNGKAVDITNRPKPQRKTPAVIIRKYR